LVVLLVGGCQSTVRAPGSKGPVALEASLVGTGFAPIWVNTDLRPIGQLVTIGSTMAGLAVHDARLFLLGIDPATGNVLWRQQTTPNLITIGEPLEVVQIGDDKVAYLRPYDGHLAQLVVAEAATGRDLATSPPALFNSLPFACIDGRDACALSVPMAGGRRRQYRLEITTDTYRKEGEVLPSDTRVLEPPSLVDLGDRPGNTIGWLRNGAIQWRTPASAAFPPGFSSDNCWTWRRFADEHVVVGTTCGPPLARKPTYVSDLEHGAATAGLSDATGEVLWRDGKSTLQCTIEKRGYPVRCRVRGVKRRKDSDRASFHELDVTVEGYEPATGKTTWSVAMGAAESLIDYLSSHAIAGPTQVVVPRSTGAVLLDYANGRVGAPPASATFWCLARASYELLPAYRDWDGPLQYDRLGGELATICDAEGRSSEQLPNAEATIAAGAHVGGYAVIASRNGYIGFRVP
jgi:hypothetical protein